MNLENYMEIYQKYFRFARKVAYDVVGNYDLAGDIVQDVFAEMFEKRAELDAEQIKYWIVLNVNRRAIDLLRKPYQRLEEWGNGEIVSPLLSPIQPEEIVLRKEEAEFQKTALMCLKEYNADWYDILMRIVIGDESYQDLALAYGMKVETLRVQVSRARKWLDKKVYEFYED